MTRDSSTESEKETRKKRIDPKLEAAGWKVVPTDTPLTPGQKSTYAVEEYETQNGPSDYVLAVDGIVLGVVEAKKVTLGPQGVLTQAERYAKGITNSLYNFNGFRVPFLYSTNGEIIWFHDIRDPLNRSRQVSAFHTPFALLEMLDRDFNVSTVALHDNKNWHELLRPYQIEANKAVEIAIANYERKMLVAMATGTGKTFTLVNQVYRLMKSGTAKRILFLVDRRALAAQAVREFASFEPEPGLKFNKIYEVYSQRFKREDLDENQKYDPKVLPEAYLTKPQKGHAFVYVCTIQRMTINLFGRGAVFNSGIDEIEDDARQLDIPIHAFDLIVADECHRGYSSAELSVWRKTLDHFDAIKLGLTATPAAHTKVYFKDVVFRYSYERAVREGYLVDYDVVTIKSDVRLQGIFLQEGEQIGSIDTVTGIEQMDLLEDEREFETTDVERRVTSPDSNHKIVEELQKYTLEHEEHYNRFPKTLIFAVNDLPHTSHADQLVDIARDIFGQGDSFVQKITGRVDRPLQRIREFRNRKLPGVVVSVDMLTTGVDIPDLEFIVFLRPVKSRILFEQMLGRGTRKSVNFVDKSHFTVFDCFDGTLLEYFKQATGITAEPPDKPSRTITEIIQDIWQNRDRKYNIRCLAKRLLRIDKEMSGDARELFASYIPNGDIAKFARELPVSLESNFTEIMDLLRNKDFHNLLVNYPKKPRVFIKAYETEDTVSSQWLIRDGSGKKHKPEDYISAFMQYVQENSDKIEAISILLDRPQNWSTDVLTELKNKLESAPERFNVGDLQKAHEHQYHKALVDIISMVKHACDEQKPLYTAEERVNHAFEIVTRGMNFTEEQEKWLERIRLHLITSLSIDRKDFDIIPIFHNAGGWGKANKVFKGELPDLLERVNEAVAA